MTTITAIPPLSPYFRQRDWAARLLAMLAALAMVGFGYESLSALEDARSYPGRRVDIGGYALHLNCIGAGSPTVVLEGGLGGAPSLNWVAVLPAARQHTRVCTYDRAGLGWSDPSPHVRDSRRIAQELHALLRAAGEPGPYVLAGYSSGGLHARLFASLYPDEVAGMVLVDAAHEDQVQRLGAEPGDPRAFFAGLRTLSLANRLGIVRVFGPVLVSLYPDGRAFPPSLHRWFPLMASPKGLRTTEAEYAAVLDSMDQVRVSRAASSAWDFPLAVIVAGANGNGPTWLALQQDLAALSTRGTLIVAPHSTHGSIIYADGMLIAEAIAQVVAAARGIQ